MCVSYVVKKLMELVTSNIKFEYKANLLFRVRIGGIICTIMAESSEKQA